MAVHNTKLDLTLQCPSMHESRVPEGALNYQPANGVSFPWLPVFAHFLQRTGINYDKADRN